MAFLQETEMTVLECWYQFVLQIGDHIKVLPSKSASICPVLPVLLKHERAEGRGVAAVRVAAVCL
jgi:hypothetical protein